MPEIHVVGGGLAGSEAALQLADRGFEVHLHDIKPHQTSPAHHNPDLAEIVCSNSLGSLDLSAASGLLKRELGSLSCRLLTMAESVSVPAGKALAVDRDKFSAMVTEAIQTHPNIRFHAGEVTSIPESEGFTIIATGPLTTPGLSEALSRLVQREQLYFFDAASPILTRDSIDLTTAFIQDRYALEREEPAHQQSYINCPLDRPQYETLLDIILNGEKIPLKDFEKDASQKAQFFESCLPVEVLASRGRETLRYGPMKPVGLLDPRTGKSPYAVVQLRRDNAEGTLYNMVGFQTNLKWGVQKEMIQRIPGLENAEIVRYGVMHRNTFIHSPEVLLPTLQLKAHANILVAGQLTGTEGYTESIATGLVAALNVARLAKGRPPLAFPRETMIGALLAYITRSEAVGKSFQPINSNWGLLPELEIKEKNKLKRNERLAERALQAISAL